MPQQTEEYVDSHEKAPSETVIGSREINLDERRDGTPTLSVDGETDGVVRELTVAKLEEGILDLKERGDDNGAKSIEDVQAFLTSLSADKAKAEGVSLIGLATAQVLKFEDLLSADVMNEAARAELEYKLATAKHGLGMMINKSNAMMNKRIQAGQAPVKPGLSDSLEEKKVLLSEAAEHNNRVKRNNERAKRLEQDQ